MFNVRQYIVEVFQDYGAYNIMQDRDDKKTSFGTKSTSAYDDVSTRNPRNKSKGHIPKRARVARVSVGHSR